MRRSTNYHARKSYEMLTVGGGSFGETTIRIGVKRTVAQALLDSSGFVGGVSWHDSSVHMTVTYHQQPAQGRLF